MNPIRPLNIMEAKTIKCNLVSIVINLFKLNFSYSKLWDIKQIINTYL